MAPNISGMSMLVVEFLLSYFSELANKKLIPCFKGTNKEMKGKDLYTSGAVNYFCISMQNVMETKLYSLPQNMTQ